MKRSAASAGRIDARAALWALCVLAIGAWLWILFARGPTFETSLFALLPESERDPSLAALTQELSGRAARALPIIVGHARRETALAAAGFVEHELHGASDLRVLAGAFDADHERAFFDLYFPHRSALLSLRLRRDLEQGAGPELLLQRLRERLQSPASGLYSGALLRDPLLLFAEFAQGLSAQSIGASSAEGFLTVEREGTTWALLAAETASDPFDAVAQRAALDAIEELRVQVARRFDGARLEYTGVPRFAAQAREAMQSDIWIIGTGSMIGTALCILLAFRSLRPFALSFLPVAIGTAAATLACLVVFARVHVLTLVFGTTLTGLGVDYALHYFAAHRLAGPDWDARRTLRDVLPGITLGVLTSVLGFSGLYFTPFPVLRQFALFSSVGLVAAWATVVCWYPALMRGAHRLHDAPWLHRQGQRFLDVWSRVRDGRTAGATLWLLGLGTLIASFGVRFDDDVHALQASPAALLAEDRRVRDVAGRTDDGRCVLVEGSTEEETLQRVEVAATVLRACVAAGFLESFRDLSLFLPSRARQAEDHTLLAAQIVPRFDFLAAGLEDLGLDPAVVADLRRDLEGPPPEPIAVDGWLASPASEVLRMLWLGPTERGFAATLILGGVRDPARVEERLGGSAGVHYIDRVRDLSRLLRGYRIDTTRLVIWAYVGVLVALLVRFGLRSGVRVMLPSLFSAGLTLAILSACGIHLNLFHMLGLLLVLGLSVDYGVIFAEKGTSEATTLFAVVLSVVTTVIAFGLMLWSSAPPLRALGASVSLGIVLALIFAPLACTRARSRPASDTNASRAT
jgi:predicted exporter